MNLYANHYECSKCDLPCEPWSRQPLTFGVPVPILSRCCQSTVRVVSSPYLVEPPASADAKEET